MPPLDDVPDWLGDLRWQGYPRLEPRSNVATSQAHRPRKAADARVEVLARENETLRAKIETLVGLVSECERRLSQTASSYEGAALENDSARRRAELERERLAGELRSASAEFERTRAREATRESVFALERERRADCEKALREARCRLNDLEAELAKTRGKASQLEGAVAELRRQADASQAHPLQAKDWSQDAQLLRREMRECLAKFRRIQESSDERAAHDEERRRVEAEREAWHAEQQKKEQT